MLRFKRSSSDSNHDIDRIHLQLPLSVFSVYLGFAVGMAVPRRGGRRTRTESGAARLEKRATILHFGRVWSVVEAETLAGQGRRMLIPLVSSAMRVTMMIGLMSMAVMVVVMSVAVVVSLMSVAVMFSLMSVAVVVSIVSVAMMVAIVSMAMMFSGMSMAMVISIVGMAMVIIIVTSTAALAKSAVAAGT